MGIDYECGTAIGFRFTHEELCKPFKQEVAEVSHLEDRFDPKTGKRIAPAVVVDVLGGESLFLDGEEFEHWQDLSQAVADKLDCRLWIDGDMNGDDPSFVFGLTPVREEAGEDFGPVSTGDHYSFADVAKLGPRLKSLKKRLEALGLEPNEARIYSTCFVY